MKVSQKIALEMSAKRETLNALLSVDEMDDAQRAEMGVLTTRMQELEVEARAAIMAEDVPVITTTTVPDGEDRELRSLIDRANVGAIFEAALEHRATDRPRGRGAIALSPAANVIPLTMLETRAVTPAPGRRGPESGRDYSWRFSNVVCGFPGNRHANRRVGDAVYPVLTHQRRRWHTSRERGQAETTGSFSADVFSRLRAFKRVSFTAERTAPDSVGMDEALRSNLSDALSDKMDQQILAGTEGLLTGTKLANHNVTAVTSYANYRSELGYGRVDGTYAGSVGDLKIVMGAETYGHAAGVFRSANAGDRAALEDLMSVTGGVKVSAHVPVASGVQQEAERRDQPGCAPGYGGSNLGRRHIIPDEITKAANGQIVVTAVMLYAIKILREAGFYKQQVQHA